MRLDLNRKPKLIFVVVGNSYFFPSSFLFYPLTSDICRHSAPQSCNQNWRSFLQLQSQLHQIHSDRNKKTTYRMGRRKFQTFHIITPMNFNITVSHACMLKKIFSKNGNINKIDLHLINFNIFTFPCLFRVEHNAVRKRCCPQVSSSFTIHTFSNFFFNLFF